MTTIAMLLPTPLHVMRRLLTPRSQAPRELDRQLVAAAFDRAGDLRTHTDGDLQSEVRNLRAEASSAARRSQPDYLERAMACVLAACQRTLGIELYDVQLLAGLALSRGAVAEMYTGEGKTLAAILPAFWHALPGRGVHVATPNDYLAQRDVEVVGPVLRLLGLTAGLLTSDIATKTAAYGCDVTYGTGYEFGFDFLRDQLTRINAPAGVLGDRRRASLRGDVTIAPAAIQRGQACVILDEIDSALIDEACLPLILATAPGRCAHDAATYLAAQQVVERLIPADDFHVDPVARSARLTSRGSQRVHHELWPGGSLPLRRSWSAYIEHALQARHVLCRDVDYVVNGDKIQVIDQATGRIFSERTWRDGLHQALEAKERLPIRPENCTSARISRQRYFHLYEQACGMTGTAAGAAEELWKLYQLPVILIPLRKPCRRIHLPTRFFVSADGKLQALVADVALRHSSGRPILVGTRTIESSEQLATRLRAAGVPCQLLNGKQDAAEAAVIARAGERGQVTIATNMAGRGTDIRLQSGVAEIGGLHVIGVEPHESQRIDRQLAGRAARQGELGSCQFFVSADDELLVRFGPRLADKMRRQPHRDGELLADLSRDLTAVQRKVEATQFAQRRQLMAYDDWLDEVLKSIAVT